MKSRVRSFCQAAAAADRRRAKFTDLREKIGVQILEESLT